MRFIASCIVTLLAVSPAAAQGPTSTTQPYGLDPYTPSQAMWLRTYGPALVSQTPIAELATLDPYKPSDATLIRQLGGGIPACCLGWYWGGFPVARAMASPLRPTPPATAAPSAGDAGPSAVVPATYQPGPTSVATLARPATNDGVSVRYDGQTWISAGRAVPLETSLFERAGELAGFVVYRTRSANDGMIYVTTRNSLVAPYRLKR